MATKEKISMSEAILRLDKPRLTLLTITENHGLFVARLIKETHRSKKTSTK